jgi:hypothetical protein
VTNEKSTAFKITFSYLVILHLIQFINIKFDLSFLKPFPIVEILSIGVFIFLVSKNFITTSLRKKQTILFHTVSFALIYYLLTILCYFQFGNTYSLLNYIYGIHHCILPIFLFYLVQLVPVDEVIILLKRILFLNFFLCFIGIILFLLQPDFYTEYLKRLFNDLNITDVWQLYGRLQSYLGSTSVGNIATVSFVLTNFLIKNKYVKSLYFITFSLTVIFTQQRGPILFLFFSVLIIFINFLRSSSAVNKISFIVKISLASLILFILYSSLITDNVTEIFNYAADRITNETNPGQLFSE